MNHIRLGLPKGSLNRDGRGNTQAILISAGYDIEGYEPERESDRRLRFANDPEILPFLTRPQSAPIELGRDMLDTAIIGEDWVKEESVNGGRSVIRIGDLGYGKTRLVLAVPNESPFESLTDFFLAQRDRTAPILMFTEYINLTRAHVMGNDGYRELYGERKPLVQVRGLFNGENDRVQIINSDGVTEGYIRKGADMIVDNSQTGRTLEEYGLRRLETVMESSAGLYAGPSCTGWKEEKAREIFEQLMGAVNGQVYFDVKFNVINGRVDGVKRYLISEGLCSDEPTVSRGDSYSTVNILIPRGRYPAVIRALKGDFGASAIVRNEVSQFIF